MTTDLAGVALAVGPRAQFCVITRLQLVARGAHTSPEVSRFALTLVDLVEGKPKLDQLRHNLLALFLIDPRLTPQRLASVLRPRQHADCAPLWAGLADVVVTIGAMAMADRASFQAEVSAMDQW